MTRLNVVPAPTTLGELVRALSLVIEDEDEVLATLRLLAESGTVRSGTPGHPRIRITQS